MAFVLASTGSIFFANKGKISFLIAKRALGEKAQQEQIDRWIESHGYHLPKFLNPEAPGLKRFTETRFVQYFSNMLTFDFGRSDLDEIPIIYKIKNDGETIILENFGNRQFVFPTDEDDQIIHIFESENLLYVIAKMNSTKSYFARYSKDGTLDKTFATNGKYEFEGEILQTLNSNIGHMCVVTWDDRPNKILGIRCIVP